MCIYVYMDTYPAPVGNISYISQNFQKWLCEILAFDDESYYSHIKVYPQR